MRITARATARSTEEVVDARGMMMDSLSSRVMAFEDSENLRD
jgi:hypothetical protein